MTKHYQPDAYGLEALARSPGMQKAMMGLAQAGASGASAIAPVATGKYKGSIKVTPTTAPAGWRGKQRSAARIEATVPYADAVERKHHVLSKIASIIESGG